MPALHTARHAFRSPPLTEAQVVRFHKLADTSVAKLVRHAELQDTSIAWTRDKAPVHGVEMFKGTDALAPQSTRTAAWTTELFGTIDDVAGMYKTDIADTDDHRACQAPHQFQAVDGLRLYCLDNTSRQYIGVHYVVTELPSFMNLKNKSIVKRRDWCFLETHTHFTLDDGRRGWARAFVSIALSCCPDVGVAMDILRGNILCGGFIFVESPAKPDYVHVTQLLQVDFNGKLHGHALGDFVVKLDFQRRAKAMATMDALLRGYRLGLAPLPSAVALTPRSTRHSCCHCRTKFGLLVPSDHCRKCGLLLCFKCTKVWTLRGHGSCPAVAVRVCKICSLGRRVHRDDTATPRSQGWPGGSYRDRSASLGVLEKTRQLGDFAIARTPTSGRKRCHPLHSIPSGRPSGTMTVRMSMDQSYSIWSPLRKSMDTAHPDAFSRHYLDSAVA
ncbi:hypothetical protein H310_03066 [Aphanomyces invadans]|uniref:FYVE-type domain-containing protein n=1 Tax=Aphanomyces invadans TaxID=157072 RepID=A0A024UMZ1_9STRA|nr:hypothetical protein H310_03066 [Aphanomyces invadans]ETW06963.1 hypothetical protein H310_03066 [Aphanomyces invadans]|eukprot:XP_008865038.1 hypothetical protein H310_03066 [Aphanomyces invadans]